MREIRAGQKAPFFKGLNQNEKQVSLRDYAGKTLVLYFYPKDDTPGCTKQACGFRDQWEALTEAGAQVLGVSPDKAPSHLKFQSKHSLPFDLLEDPDHAIAEAYGVWVEKALYGRKYMGVERSTFIIGSQGEIRAVFRRVKVEGHVAQVLEALREKASSG